MVIVLREYIPANIILYGVGAGQWVSFDGAVWYIFSNF